MSSLDLVFNDHSAQSIALNSHDAGLRIKGLIDVLLLAPEHGFGKGLRIPQNFYLLKLADQYTFMDWLNSASTPREEKEFILQLATRSPFLTESSPDIQNRAALCEVHCGDSASSAFQAAYLLNYPLLSFCQAPWDLPSLHATASQMDDEGELRQFPVSLINIAHKEHFTQHSGWIEARRQREIHDSAVLWKNRETIFPSLEFCPCVKDQLSLIPENSDLFTQILDRLFDLQRVAALGIAFHNEAFRTKCSPSSSSTIQNFGEHYSFRRVDDTLVQCGWHLYLPDGNRIYFTCDKGDWVIGHIGGHLPTSKFPK